MASLEEGKTYTLEEEAEWKTLELRPGQVIEAGLQISSIPSYCDKWAAFLVENSRLEENGTLTVGRYLGCTDPTEGSRLLEVMPSEASSISVPGMHVHQAAVLLRRRCTSPR